MRIAQKWHKSAIIFLQNSTILSNSKDKRSEKRQNRGKFRSIYNI